MSRHAQADNLPPTARAIALLIASTPTVQDVQPGVLHQLLEFSHRYTAQVLSDALVYADHAGRSGKLDMDDIVLAVQARVGWEFGGRVPKEYTLSLAAQTNAASLPAVPEVFGVRLPSPADSLTAVDFDLIPNKPPPGVKLYDEEIEEVEESESEEDDDEDMEPAAIPAPAAMRNTTVISTSQDHVMDVSSAHDAPFPISAIQTLSDIDMIGTPVVVAGVRARIAVEEGSDAAEEEEGLFAGGDDEEEEESDAMEQVQMAPGGNGPGTNGVKRKLVEEEDYD